MLNQTLPADLPATIQLTGSICQICTTWIAAVMAWSRSATRSVRTR
jgi:hypothetical protein